jgi:hypothetical protein
MYYRCIRFNTNQERNKLETQFYWSKKNLSVLKNGAPDCPVHQAVQLQTSHSREFQGALRYNSPDCPVCQRSNDSLRQRPTLSSEQCSIVSHISQSNKVRGHQTVRCSKTTKAPMVDQLRTLTVALTWCAPDSAQWLSGAPIASSLHQRLWKWLGAINTPNHLIHIHPSIPNISFNTRAKDSTPRHIK